MEEQKTARLRCSPGTVHSVTGSQAERGVTPLSIRASQGIYHSLSPAKGSGDGGGSGSVLAGLGGGGSRAPPLPMEL